eukprot:gene4019-4987_t
MFRSIRQLPGDADPQEVHSEVGGADDEDEAYSQNESQDWSEDEEEPEGANKMPFGFRRKQSLTESLCSGEEEDGDVQLGEEEDDDDDEDGIPIDESSGDENENEAERKQMFHRFQKDAAHAVKAAAGSASSVPPLLNLSLFEDRPPSVVFHSDWFRGTVSFPESPQCKQAPIAVRGESEDCGNSETPDFKKQLSAEHLAERSQIWTMLRKYMSFKIGYKTTMIRKLHGCGAFAETMSGRWNSYWGMALPIPRYNRLKSYQRVNHFPGTFELGRKDRLSRAVMRMHRRVQSAHRTGVRPDSLFIPDTYFLPKDWKQFKAAFEAADGVWIWKPNAAARGIGVKVITKLCQIPRWESKKLKNGLVQQYIPNPLLLNGCKSDLRIYVAVTCYNPLRVYIYPEGLVRITTKAYKPIRKNSVIRSRFMHLTNYSVNKRSKDFVKNTDVDEDGVGNKWSLTALWQYLRDEGHSQEKVDQVWENIKNTIGKTIIAADTHINTQLNTRCSFPNACYELFGVDIMLDSTLKPWLIEVNTSPDLSPSSPMDKRIKGEVLTWLFHMLRFVPVDKKEIEQQEEDSKQSQLLYGRRASTNGQAGPAQPGMPLPPVSSARTRLHNSAELPWWTSLTEVDLEMIKTSQDEYNSCGPYQRVIPSEDPYLLPFFEVQRRFNNILHQWVK